MANLGDATKITSGIALNTLVNETLEFVRKQLPGWRDDPERPEEVSEEKLNSNLCDYLNYRARHSYPMAVFHHEEFQTGRRRIDLSVKTEQVIIAGTRKYTKYDPYLHRREALARADEGPRDGVRHGRPGDKWRPPAI